ncbi:MAG: HDOD domain-containing protein [Pseudodesulfovibrio sp.]|jgi:putative nucleotidyltransferase with HDIG domain|uniref:Nucleotidyltransferase with HDIG domain n=2 Tax=Pseudodesulfovibrio indicus TaxID=1716143 RepID=A0AA94TJ10_9BACT|nr:HDOD domain-containing protein [Pseudodesulfovibrio indicus]TDT85531.1 putative nucleotidyltransferase with HDIG domain [Pseudodesulfovibrio indicus]
MRIFDDSMSDVRDRLLEAVERMPAFPESVHQVLTLSQDINCSQKELVEVIKKDPVFTLKILRLVNSPYFGLSREITSINHASVYLGLNTLKNVALGLAAVGAIPRSASTRMDMGAFWLHSLAVATCASMLGRKLGVSRDDTANYFASGLLHDIGKVVFALYLPEEFEKVVVKASAQGEPMHQCELEIIGATHADLGGMLADKWNLPSELRDAIALHHSSGGIGSQLNDCLFIANQITKKLSFGSAGNFVVEPLAESMVNRFSMDMDALIADLPSLAEEVESARIFIKLGESR